MRAMTLQALSISINLTKRGFIMHVMMWRALCISPYLPDPHVIVVQGCRRGDVHPSKCRQQRSEHSEMNAPLHANNNNMSDMHRGEAVHTHSKCGGRGRRRGRGWGWRQGRSWTGQRDLGFRMGLGVATEAGVDWDARGEEQVEVEKGDSPRQPTPWLKSTRCSSVPH
jgi:hypothetical protein